MWPPDLASVWEEPMRLGIGAVFNDKNLDGAEVITSSLWEV